MMNFERWVQLCTCGGPQPGLSGDRADEHMPECEYRLQLQLQDAGPQKQILERGTSYLIFAEDRAMRGRSIFCLKCNQESYNPQDVEQKYCGHCHAYHMSGV
jgi:hypothetical protein